MVYHEVSPPESQHICDKLLHLIQKQLPNIKRKETEKTCCIFQENRSRFVYIYHLKKSSKVKIYFRSSPELSFQKLPSTLHLQKRPQFEGSWEKTFPYYFDIYHSEEVQEIVDFLVKEAYPLTLKPNQRVGQARSLELMTEEVNEKFDFLEGSIKSIQVNAYERNRKARQTCLEHHGTSCIICGFSFAIYGQSFSEFIHVHHLTPLASISKEYRLNPLEDLKPVCPNCHAVIHRRDPPFTIDEVKQMLEKHNK